MQANAVEKDERSEPTFKAVGIQQVKHDDGHGRPGQDESQHQDPGHGRAERTVEVIGHGALGRASGLRAHIVLALNYGCRGGGGPNCKTG